MKPETFASLVCLHFSMRKGLVHTFANLLLLDWVMKKPFICTMDSIGAKELAKDFVVAGTASESLYGACESMFKPDMEAEELFETISQALLSSVDRDCLSGWGGHVYLVNLMRSALNFCLFYCWKSLIHTISEIEAKQMDYLVCGSTWDILLHREFLRPHLLKLAWWQPYLTLFSYSSTCYAIWNLPMCLSPLCVESYGLVLLVFSALDFCCTYLCFKLRTRQEKTQGRKRDLEEFATTSDENCELGENSITQHTTNLEHRRSQVSKRRDYKNKHLRRSLRPRSHRPRMKLSGVPSSA
ncbi:Proteasome subunit beta type-3-B [Sesamum angolense]|uniref:Proteasome subunit beta type-3-B n=1 Tax=Sesamum angolense TaxID=2727404 RepID=A0AAE1WCZ0_9LAMI|nr:Proteasome subunit beta type-3-B [Sesamum angolense]